MAGPGGAGGPMFFPPGLGGAGGGGSHAGFWPPAAAHHYPPAAAAAAAYLSHPPPPPSSLPPLFPPTPSTSTFPALGGGYGAAMAYQGAPGAVQARGPPNALSPGNPSPPSRSSAPSPPGPTGSSEAKSGIGNLTWLSSKAGLIQCDEASGLGSVSFQLKDFCDQAVTDLTSVLRPGFVLQFWAIGQEGGLVATFVRPLPSLTAGAPGQKLEALLEAPPGQETGPPQLPKDPYNLELEKRAIPVLLEIFKRNGLTYCQLSGFHTAISNCGDEDLYRYVGTSSLKRRQFLERRTHIFFIAHTDTVSLQPAPLYTTLCRLNAFLLSHGGACFLQQLFDHFGACPEIPLEAREMIGEGKTAFLRFLEQHPWIFAVFPSRVFVSARRQLIDLDYPAYMQENFGDQDPGDGLRHDGSPGGGADRPPPTPTLPAAELRSSTTAFGSNTSLDGVGGPAPLASSVPPTPTSQQPGPWPPQPAPARGYQHPAYGGRASGDGRGGAGGPFPDPYAGPGAAPKRNWLSQPTPPPPTLFPGPPPPPPPPQQAQLANGMGGRIKRFTDVQAQTERPNMVEFAAALGLDLRVLAAYLRPPSTDASTQTGGGGSREASPLSASPPGLKSAEQSLSSPSVPASEPEVRCLLRRERERRKGRSGAFEEEGPSETGVLTGLDGLGSTGYDPILGSDNLLSRGLLKSLNL